jgi:hypothetical protein
MVIKIFKKNMCCEIVWAFIRRDTKMYPFVWLCSFYLCDN